MQRSSCEGIEVSIVSVSRVETTAQDRLQAKAMGLSSQCNTSTYEHQPRISCELFFDQSIAHLTGSVNFGACPFTIFLLHKVSDPPDPVP